MGVINLTIQGEMVKFAEATESLSAYAESAPSAPAYPQGATAWDQVNETVGSYNPFDSFERGGQF